MRRRHTITVVAVAVAAAGLAACAPATTPAPAGPSTATSASQSPAQQVLLVDVRTPAEFAEGHLQGAVNIPVESPDFVAQVSSLAGTAAPAVYCRSGNRSGQAADMLTQAGISTIDLGGYQQAAEATGLPTVR